MQKTNSYRTLSTNRLMAIMLHVNDPDMSAATKDKFVISYRKAYHFVQYLMEKYLSEQDQTISFKSLVN